MKILVIESSPHKKGSSNLLAERFMEGAKEAGHEVRLYDAGHGNVAPCIACDVCGMDGPCCQKDDMGALREKILSSDMMVFVTPLYYFGFSAQLKKVIDRFYSFNGRLAGKRMKTALIAAAWDSQDWTMRDLYAHYQTLCRYLHFQDMGAVLGIGCGSPQMTKRTEFPEQAYRFGRSL